MSLNVGVFFGGSSVEHEISVISAVQAMRFIDKEKYNIIPIYITKEGEMFTGETLCDIENYSDMGKLLANAIKVAVIKNGKDVVGVRANPKKFGKNQLFTLDVAFPIVHGTNCEDGSLQGYLELLRLPYVGCDVYSSALGMDKVAMKHTLMANNIPVLPCLKFDKKQWNKTPDEMLNKAEKEIGYPMIVKPINLGSSIGITKAVNRDELTNALDVATSFSQFVMVEHAILNLKEVNCSVLGDYEEAKASVCEEPVSSDKILSYNDKYASGGSKGSKGMSSLKRKIPAEITPEQEAKIKELAVDTFKALGCSGVSRIDFMIDMDNGKIYANEINTIPGSLSFYLWEPMGKPYKELINDLISLALKRERERKNLMFTYDSNIFKTSSFKGLGGAKGSKA